MFDFDKFCEEFEKADVYTTIKGLCLKLSSAENDIDRTAITSHLFDMVDLTEAGDKTMADHCDHWKKKFFEEHKKNIELQMKIKEIQKAAST